MPDTALGLHVVEHAPSHGAPTDPGSPLVVLVHGSLDRGTSFARVVRRLSDLHVITYDRRGYHRSREAAGPGADRGGSPFERHVEDLLEIVRGRKSVLIGHSFGADIVLGAAVAAPPLVRAVGLYEPPTPWFDWWPRRRALDPAGDAAAHAEAFFRRVVSDEAWERLPEHAKQERRADGPALVSELADLRERGAPFGTGEVVVPVVLGRGERSIDRHRRATEALSVQIEGAVIFEIKGASHGAHLSHPDGFAQFVRLAVKRSADAERAGHHGGDGRLGGRVRSGGGGATGEQLVDHRDETSASSDDRNR